MAKKDEKYYKKKVKEMKKEKRDLCSPVSEQDYDSKNLDGKRNNNKEIKKIKEDFKRVRRSIKRSEKQNVQKEIEEELDSNIDSDINEQDV